MNVILKKETTTQIHLRFVAHILYRNYLPNQSSILLAISGGQDSLCLLKLIIDFQNYYRWNIGIVYFDHKYRQDTYYNNKQVLSIAKFFKIKTYVYEHKIQHYSEIESREWRYKNIVNTASYYEYSVITTAHTKTDRSETFLQYILRGCGTDSLSSIPFRIKITHKMTILRPLVIFSRSETLWLSRKFSLPIWSDFTNYEHNIRRNRLREELFPYLQQHFQPQIHNVIQVITDRAQIDSEYLQKATIKLYFLIKHPKFIAINYSVLLKQPKTLQYRIFKLFFKHNFNLQVTQRSISDIIQIAQETNIQFKQVAHPKLKLYLAHHWFFTLK